MKKLLLFSTLILGFTIVGFSQSFNLPIKFQATESSEMTMGKAWDFSFTKSNEPMNISFDGKVLKMYFSSGRKYLEKKIISYQKKEKKDYDKTTSIAYILKTMDSGFIEYIILKREFDILNISEIQIPILTPLGMTYSYIIYQKTE